MILDIFPRAGGEDGIEQIPSVFSRGGKEDHGQPRLPDGTEVQLHQKIGRKGTGTPEDIIGLLAQVGALRVFEPEPALRKAHSGAALQAKAPQILFRGERVLIDQGILQGIIYMSGIGHGKTSLRSKTEKTGKVYHKTGRKRIKDRPGEGTERPPERSRE
jgi:hypothetical protein